MYVVMVMILTCDLLHDNMTCIGTKMFSSLIYSQKSMEVFFHMYFMNIVEITDFLCTKCEHLTLCDY